MRIGTSYKQHPGLADEWDAIVIGSGIGGLAAAATLAKIANKRVLVLERHYTAGGFTHTFRRPGYEWDVGIHYIGEVSHPRGMARRLFDFITEGELEWADMGDVYDRIILGDNAYDLVKGYENYRAQLHEYFPQDKDAIDQYLGKVVATVKKAAFFFAEKAVPPYVSALFGGMMRRPALKEATRTTREVLEEITQNQELIGVLTGQCGDYGLVPAKSSFFIHAMVVAHYFRGAGYPVGGSSRIAQTILPLIERAGGEVVTNAEVAEIIVDDGRAVGVKLFDGHQLRAPVVISDAGVINTFEQLVSSDIAKEIGYAAKARRVGASIAHLSLYIGLKGTTEELQLEKTNLWVYQDHDHEKNFERFEQDLNAPFPVVYMSFPSAKDPDFDRRYPGHSTIEAITLGSYDQFKRWENTSWKKRGAEYDELKASLSERLLDTVYKYAPATRGRVEIAELSTPLTTKNFAAHPEGAIYGLTHTPERYQQRWLRPRTPIRGLYLAGADVVGAGLMGAMMGGLSCSSAVLGSNVLGQVLKHQAQALRDKAPAARNPARA
jgi:all-trans-retinol 13,14-reductase